MGNESSSAAPGPGEGPKEDAIAKEKLKSIQRMDASLRKKLRGGVAYNLKVVLKGERGSGKTALLQRLQGRTFVPEVRPRGAAHRWRNRVLPPP